MGCSSAATTGSRPTRAMHSGRRASGTAGRLGPERRAPRRCDPRRGGCLGVARAPALGLAIAATMLYVLVVGPGASVVRAGSPASSSPWRGLRTGQRRAGTCSPSRRPDVSGSTRGRSSSRASSCRSSPSSRSSSRRRGSGAGSRAPRVLRGCASRLRSRRPAPSRPRRSRGCSSTASRSPAAFRRTSRRCRRWRPCCGWARRDARASARARGRGAARARCDALGEYLVVVAHAGARIDHFAGGAEVVLAIGVP